MSIQPDSIRFHHPHEAEEPTITPYSNYTDATEPNEPCDYFDDAEHIVLYHIKEYIENDTEDERVRVAALTCDLGVPANRMGFRYLVDTYREPMTRDYADKWMQELADYIQAHGIKKGSK